LASGAHFTGKREELLGPVKDVHIGGRRGDRRCVSLVGLSVAVERVGGVSVVGKRVSVTGKQASVGVYSRKNSV
jgi:hypothetical protein